MALAELLGPSLLTKEEGGKPTQEALEGCAAVGLYFSAHWCPPCRTFTPKLAEQFTSHYKDKGLKVVFVSSDKDEKSFQEYYDSMPWLALPFGSDRVDALKAKFDVAGIPKLVILDPEGEVITKEGRGCVVNDPQGELFPWKTQPEAPAAGGVLKHGQTQNYVDEVHRSLRRAQTWQLLSIVLSVGFSALWFWGWSRAAATCAGGPLEMRTVFLTWAIFTVINIVLAVFNLAMLRKALNDHVCKAAYYKNSGRDEEAAQETKAAMQEGTAKYMTCLCLSGCCTTCFSFFQLLVWFWVCLASAVSAANLPALQCPNNEINTYWATVGCGFLLSCCTSSISSKEQKKVMARK
uniref:Thioredoxin domain-containing protein n=1 Tax=Zooxanthella nutricula TaxID=1333877 RepID=A0A7S2QLM6_9DINO